MYIHDKEWAYCLTVRILALSSGAALCIETSSIKHVLFVYNVKFLFTKNEL